MHVELQNRSFTCILGDNAEHEDHRAGYNGVWSLVPEGMMSSLFVPGIAGLNLEHYFDAWRDGDRSVLFDPRVSPMKLERPRRNRVRLIQAATEIWGVESVTDLTVRQPDVIDLDFRCIPRKDVFHNGMLGVFWASYMHHPESKSIHFIGRQPGETKDGWQTFASAQHGEKSSVRGLKDRYQVEVGEGGKGKLFGSVAEVRWSEPWYYGRWQEYAYLVAFKTRNLLRFAMSPSGGGNDNPAWDFQMLVPEMKVGREYRLSARCVVTRWTNADDLARRARRWLE